MRHLSIKAALALSMLQVDTKIFGKRSPFQRQSVVASASKPRGITQPTHPKYEPAWKRKGVVAKEKFPPVPRPVKTERKRNSTKPGPFLHLRKSTRSQLRAML